MHTSLILLLAAAGSILGLASAEAPINVCCMAYTTVNNTLYVQGGAGPLIIHNSQFFSLDLTLSGWNTSSPHWKVLPVGAGAHSAPFEHYHTMTATKDKKDLVVWGSRTGISTYNFATTTWTNDTAYDPISLLGAGKDPMGLDPITGLIYIPTVANNGTGMRIYNSDTRTSSIVPMYPSTILPYQAKAFTFVWSELRKSFLFFGGFGLVNDIPQYNDSMIEYQPSTYSWTRVPTSGRPGLLASHCMIPAYGGTKMVVFGGWQGLRSVASQTPSYSSALYMLDVNEMKWTLISEGAVVGRRDMACAVVGDNFVAWGGIDNNDQVAGTLIYNLKSNQWTDTYIAASAESPPPSSSSTSKLGIYIGVGIAAGVLLGGVVGWLAFRCRKRRRIRATGVLATYKQLPSRSAAPQGMQDEKAAIQRSPHTQLPRDLQGMRFVDSKPYVDAHGSSQAYIYTNVIPDYSNNSNNRNGLQTSLG